MMRERYPKRTTAQEVLQGHDLSDATIVVTGATGRIGFAITQALASAGATVTLAARNADNGNAALTRLGDAGCGERAEFRRLDLASLAQIQTFCDTLPHQRLTALICAAGLIPPLRYQSTEEGLERSVGSCHFGHFYLFCQLWPRMRAAGASRLVMVSSAGHRFAKLRLDRFPMSPQRYNPFQAYCQTKAAHILMVRELARRHAAHGLTASANHPGMVLTGSGADPALLSLASRLFRPVVDSAAEGAAASAIGIVGEPAEDLSGQYLSGNRVVASGGATRDSQLAQDLWELSERRLAELGHPVPSIAGTGPAPPAEPLT